MHKSGLSCSLRNQQEKGVVARCPVSFIVYVYFTYILQLTWEMLIPVSFSTAEGSLVMISSTSPESLAAPTSPLPLDTIVTLLAAHSGLLISSAICRQQWIQKLIEVKLVDINPTYMVLFDQLKRATFWLFSKKCEKQKIGIHKTLIMKRQRATHYHN